MIRAASSVQGPNTDYQPRDGWNSCQQAAPTASARIPMKPGLYRKEANDESPEF